MHIEPSGWVVTPSSVARCGCRPSLTNTSISRANSALPPSAPRSLSSATVTGARSPSRRHFARNTDLKDPAAIASGSTSSVEKSTWSALSNGCSAEGKAAFPATARSRPREISEISDRTFSRGGAEGASWSALSKRGGTVGTSAVSKNEPSAFLRAMNPVFLTPKLPGGNALAVSDRSSTLSRGGAEGASSGFKYGDATTSSRGESLGSVGYREVSSRPDARHS
mmetsp:Transcript_8714/g.21581  ORF Transcript_8714/g.21581 Transcript_8714/m.21581 type:complete len:224 (-) Transcript_8714:877-1548(-)